VLIIKNIVRDNCTHRDQCIYVSGHGRGTQASGILRK
jgi:hypothetical protein